MIRFLWHVIGLATIRAGQDHSLTNLSGCWLQYLAHLPRAKLIVRFGVYLRVKFFLHVRLAEAEQLFISYRTWGWVHLQKFSRGVSLMAVLCLSHVLFKVMPWCNFWGFLPFVLMVLQLLHKSQRLLWGMRFRWGRTYSEDLSDPNVDAMTLWLQGVEFSDTEVFPVPPAASLCEHCELTDIVSPFLFNFPIYLLLFNFLFFTCMLLYLVRRLCNSFNRTFLK